MATETLRKETSMLVEFSIDNVSQMGQWDRFVRSHSEGSPFHLSAWISVIHKAYSLEPVLYVLLDEGGAIVGVAPFFITRRPVWGRPNGFTAFFRLWWAAL